MRRSIPVLIALGALALPAGAAAKEVESATVCGTNGCATTHDRDRAMAILEAGGASGPPDRPARYFTIRVAMAEPGGEAGTFVVRWVPSLGLIRAGEPGDPVWFRPPYDATALLRKLGDGLRPFPARGLRPLGAAPGGQLAPDVTPAPAAAPASGRGRLAPDVTPAPAAEPASGGVSTVAWIAIAGGALPLAGGLTLLVLHVRRRHRPADGPLAAGE